MTYAEVLPTLIEENLVQTMAPSSVPATFPWWDKVDRFSLFHQGTPGHNIEHCLVLKAEVQKLIWNNILSFDLNLNVQVYPLPNHGTASVNTVLECSGKFIVYNI
jgi:hypothetical protein